MTLTKDHKATLNKVDDGFYRWAPEGLAQGYGWTIQRIRMRKAPTYYNVRNERLGLVFEAPNLQTVRQRLPVVDTSYRIDETLLDGVEKTEEKLDQEARERPQAEKLAAADATIRDIVDANAVDAEKAYNKIVGNLQEGSSPGRLPHEVAWSGDAVRKGFLYRHCALLLVERRQDGKPFTPEDRLETITRHHHRFLNDLLSNTMYTAGNSGSFQRVVAEEERRAAIDYFNLLESCLRIYAEEYVEDAPKAVTSRF